MLIFVLPLLVVGQAQNYRAYDVTVGQWDGESWNWNESKPCSIGIVFDSDALEYTIYAKKTTTLNIVSVQQSDETLNTTTYILEALDQDGVYVVITEIIPKDNKYAYLLIVIYPDFGVKYEIKKL